MSPDHAAKFGVRDGASGKPPTLQSMGNEDVVPYLVGYLVGQAEFLAAEPPRTLAQRLMQIARASKLAEWQPR